MLSAWSIIGWSSFFSVTADQPARFSGRECTSLPSRDLRCLAFELIHVAGRCAVDGNSPRLHRLGNFPEQLDLQQAVLERGAPHLDIVGEIELSLERPGGPVCHRARPSRRSWPSIWSLSESTRRAWGATGALLRSPCPYPKAL